MARTLSTEMQALATSDLVRPIMLIDLEFSTTLNIWNGIGNLTHGGNTYTGVGDLLGVSPMGESTDISAKGCNITLSGANASLVDKAKSEDYQGNSVSIKLGAMDDNGDIISEPVVIFKGFMDVMSIVESGEYSTISISVENNLILFDKAKVRRYTDNDQKIDHPTDEGFSFVANIQNKQMVWGRSSGSSGGGAGGHFDPRDNRYTDDDYIGA